MALAYNGSITLTGTPNDICTIPGGNTVAVSFTGTKVQVWDVSTRTQVGSDLTITTGVVASGYIGSNQLALVGTSTSALLNLSTGTLTTGIAVGPTLYNPKYCQVASQPASDVGYCTSSTAGNLGKFNSASVTGSVLTPQWLNNVFVTAVIAKDTTGFIFATSHGHIVETDTSANVVKQYTIPIVKGNLEWLNGTSVNQIGVQAVGSMSYYNGYLLVSTSLGQVILFDHDSGIELQRFTGPQQTNTVTANPQGPLLAASSDHVTVMGIPPTNGAFGLVELDFLLTPVKQKSNIFYDSSVSSGAYIVGINGTIAWVGKAANGAKIQCFSISSKRSVTFNSASSSSSPSEIMTINDAGIGNAATGIEFISTCPAAGKQIPTTTSGNFIKLASTINSNGINETGQVLR
jgi:hypothetical protein